MKTLTLLSFCLLHYFVTPQKNSNLLIEKSIHFYQLLEDSMYLDALDLLEIQVVQQNHLTVKKLQDTWEQTSNKPASPTQSDTNIIQKKDHLNFVYHVNYNEKYALKTCFNQNEKITGFFLVYKEEPLESEKIKDEKIAISKNLFSLMSTNQFSSVKPLLDPEVFDKVSANTLQEEFQKTLKKTGEFLDLKKVYYEIDEDRESSVFSIYHCQKGDFAFATYFNSENKIQGFQSIPNWMVTEILQTNTIKTVKNGQVIKWLFNGGKNIRPAELPSTIDERDLLVQTDNFSLPGKLTIPSHGKNFPIVILVHGSGPSDMNSSIGQNEPFKDLAYGLAENGIACIRYDKRTYVYGTKSASNGSITLNDEVLDDVNTAVKMCRRIKKIDASRIWILGHSMGGSLTPKILDENETVYGGILLAGTDTKPIEDEMIRQVDYILKNDTMLTEAEREELIDVKTKCLFIKNNNLSTLKSDEYILGAPVGYWEELKSYNSLETSNKIKNPMLVLQGKRDYQVLYSDFMIWKKELEKNKNFTFISYDELNHIFIKGNETSTPGEYFEPGKIPDYVIKDISNFINSHGN